MHFWKNHRVGGWNWSPSPIVFRVKSALLFISRAHGMSFSHGQNFRTFRWCIHKVRPLLVACVNSDNWRNTRKKHFYSNTSVHLSENAEEKKKKKRKTIAKIFTLEISGLITMLSWTFDKFKKFISTSEINSENRSLPQRIFAAFV